MVTNLQHAMITSTLTHAPVSNFTLADVEAGDIQLTQDGSSVTPSYTITATIIITDFSSAPDAAAVLFSDQGVYAPQLVNNYLRSPKAKPLFYRIVIYQPKNRPRVKHSVIGPCFISAISNTVILV